MLRLRHPVALLLISILVLLGVLRSYSTPSPVGADAPDVVFSADRADAILRDLLSEGVPHVSGSPYNTVVRNRVVALLEAAGYIPEVQSRFHCNPLFGTCSPVENVVAVKKGSGEGQAVLLTAHYDSGWAGPGAADDGAGTAAILEIARMAADFPPFRNDIVFLITDSEENGLIGADAFAQHHPLFENVKAVINLEARGVTGPSAMFETGEGNRSIVRMLSKNVPRPVANSLVYEIYKRMPNDTDYTVYRRQGVQGVNFAFAQGVALYHSARDDPDHLDLGSLQHHGDNAWGMLKALGERDLQHIIAREDAGFIDIFGNHLAHYPVSITGGLALVLGTWVMLAIGLAFRRDFRFRQMGWVLLAIPFLLAAVIAGGYLLSWPLGRWPDLHPLEHPQPWPGRLTLWLMLILAGYTTLKLFAGRVSPCGWMITGWALIVALAMTLTSRLPSASHLAMIPLALFAFGSVIDLFRRKSKAPLLMASLLGFAGTVFIAFYHFLMLDVVMNFDKSHLKIVPFGLPALTVMPMVLAWANDRDLTWRPAQWLLGAVLAGCVVHFFLPGYTPERPRDMTLMYREVEGEHRGHLVLESIYRRHDRSYARGHQFEPTELNDGRLGTVERPAREIAPLDLPGAQVTLVASGREGEGWRRELEVVLQDRSPLLSLALPLESGLQKAWVNGVLALDTSLEYKRKRSVYTLRVVHPGDGPLSIGLLTSNPDPLTLSVLTWHDLPAVLVAPFMGNWPDEAQPFLFGPRAEKIQGFELMRVEEVSPSPSIP